MLTMLLAQVTPEIKFDWTLNLVGLIGICFAIFGICAFIVRQKDIAILKPQIERVPLIEASINDTKQDVAEIKHDIAEIKGAMSAIPAMSVRVTHAEDDMKELKARVLWLEQNQK